MRLHLHPGARCDSEKDVAPGGQRKSAHHDRFRRPALCSNHSLSSKNKVAAIRNRNTPRSSRSIPKIPGARTLDFLRLDRLESAIRNERQPNRSSRIRNAGSAIRLPDTNIRSQACRCDKVDILFVNLNEPDNLFWLRRRDFYFVCGPHRRWNSN
jgi:hypothetical protein